MYRPVYVKVKEIPYFSNLVKEKQGVSVVGTKYENDPNALMQKDPSSWRDGIELWISDLKDH